MNTIAESATTSDALIRKSGDSLFSTRAMKLFLLMLLAVTLLRLVAMVFVPLVPEEAYYWMYWQNPNLSYFDHPPMVAWVIGLGTSVFGHNEFGVRIVGTLMMIGTSVLMYAYASRWFTKRAAIAAAMALHILPAYLSFGFIATMDSALMFFWMICLLALTWALRDQWTEGWYIAGAAVGAAMLSKYTGVFLVSGIALAMLVHQPWRRHWLSIHPYLALLLAMVIFSPVVIWNAQNDWASFRFQFIDRFKEGEPVQLHRIVSYLGLQVLILTPLILFWLGLMLAHVLSSRRRWRSPHNVLALAFSLPMLVVMTHKSLRYNVHINWTLPLFLSLLPALAQWFLARWRLLRTSQDRLRWRRAGTWTLAGCLGINVGLFLYLLTLQPMFGWIEAFGPWRELAVIVEQYEDQLEDQTHLEPLILGDGKYRLASVLAFYRNDLELEVSASRYTTSRWILDRSGLGYAYWSDQEQWTGTNCIYVSSAYDNSMDETLANHFDEVKFVEDERLSHIVGGPYRLAICYRFRPQAEFTSR